MTKYLLHALKTHLMVMGKPTEVCCAFALKVIDILTDDEIRRKDAESLSVLHMILENIVLSILDAIDTIESNEAKKHKVLSPALESTRKILKTKLQQYNDIKTEKSSVIEIYGDIIKEIAKSMKLFNFCGLNDKVEITDVYGNKIC